eukprot:3454964-Rhodomonas_salina.3
MSRIDIGLLVYRMRCPVLKPTIALPESEIGPRGREGGEWSGRARQGTRRGSVSTAKSKTDRHVSAADRTETLALCI